MGDDWRSDLETWLRPFAVALGHKTRGRMCPSYVTGLIGPGGRKSVQPMAARDGAVSYDHGGASFTPPLNQSLPYRASDLTGPDPSPRILFTNPPILLVRNG